RSRESLCFTMIRPSLHARWTKQHSHIGKRAKATKRIGCHENCTNDIRITPPAGRPSRSDGFLAVTFCRGRLPKPSFLGNSCDTPRTVTDFDTAQFFPRFYIYDRDIVRCTVGG